MTWNYIDERTEFDPTRYSSIVGFVYLIENVDTGMKYVGKKLLTKSVRYQKNNKKKTKRVESDWKTYTGSNEQLNEDISRGANIKKTILHLCTTKGWMTYYETKEILVRDAIISEDYYNTWVQCKIRRSHLKLGERSGQ